MNLGDIQTRVFRTFGDEAAIQITPDDVIRWVNDAQREIAITAGLMETVGTTFGVATGGPLPEDLLTLHSVHAYPNTGDESASVVLSVVSFTEGERLLNTANPEGVSLPSCYWTFGRTLFLYPALTCYIKVFYTREPTPVSNVNDVLDLPVNYHTRIYEYCMKQAYELDENFEAAALKGAEMDKNIQTQQNQEAWNSQKLYPFINASEDF